MFSRLKLDLKIPYSLILSRIDPIGCEDVDDALCVRRLPNGDIELSVHIADVSFFVKPGINVFDYHI